MPQQSPTQEAKIRDAVPIPTPSKKPRVRPTARRSTDNSEYDPENFLRENDGFSTSFGSPSFGPLSASPVDDIEKIYEPFGTKSPDRESRTTNQAKGLLSKAKAAPTVYTENVSATGSLAASSAYGAGKDKATKQSEDSIERPASAMTAKDAAERIRGSIY